MTTIKKHFERVTYDHLGVSVHVEINYDAGTISLCEQDGGLKKWLFAGRQRIYMEGWQNIFKAMAYAVEEANKALKKHQDAEDRAKARMIAMLSKEK